MWEFQRNYQKCYLLFVVKGSLNIYSQTIVDQIKFNYHNKMIKTIFRGIASIASRTSLYKPSGSFSYAFFKRYSYSFSEQKNIAASPAIVKPQDIKVSTAKVGEEEVEMVKTTGAISIMDRIPGVKAESGEMYVLSFTCTKCQTKSIRSFTKHAYHKGVVLVRCGGCENIHLVADNIGWFQDTPVNIETMHQGKVKRIQDPIVIGKFLQTAFQQESQDKKTKEHL